MSEQWQIRDHLPRPGCERDHPMFSSRCLCGGPFKCVSSGRAPWLLEIFLSYPHGKDQFTKSHMGKRLGHIAAHDALILLCNSCAIPKLLYTLRTAPCFFSPVLEFYDGVLKSDGHETAPPADTAANIQRAWDSPIVSNSAESLLNNAWLGLGYLLFLLRSLEHAVPISTLGQRMDNDTICVAVGLHLGSTLCRPHLCQHCGAEVDRLASMGSAARKVRDAITATQQSTTLCTVP